MPVAEALALQPHLHVQELDPQADERALQELAEWMERFSPIVGLDETTPLQSLLVDITGCAACFHGEDKLVKRAERELRNQGWIVRIAVADTLGVAWGLAHFASNLKSQMGFGYRISDFVNLPVAALRLHAETVQALTELGIEQIHQLMALPRTSLPARFGAILLHRLDQALGRLPEMIRPHRPAPEMFAVYPFEYATDRIEALNIAIDHLTERIHFQLQSCNRGARRVECRLYHETAVPRRIETALFRPSRSAEHLRMLLRAQLERVRGVEPIVAVDLRVIEMAPLAESQGDFFEADRRNQERALADLIDQLSGRLGREAVTRAALVPDPQPEYAYRFEPLIRLHADEATNSGAGWPTPLPTGRGSEKRRQNTKQKKRRERKAHPVPQGVSNRPLRFWKSASQVEVMSVVPEGPPIRLRWAGQNYRIIRAWGPERIETGWWRGLDVHRDYYIVATHTGSRFWLFRRHEDGRWFVQGCYE
jgi:protein ImuB